ncbi:hypothetical protein N7510_007833 [Penicillium lagena]|uniref:uncharacterized protein n=1 Tax=Penicillium lagena TaxID=94218 RepID=UPI0025411FE3|nr:uncharacterized protein N7510_007833 [Penicillium lagena]KAJ5611114.1 hypothetical protein N7510_007833 [Penicillium lagena]
MALSLSRSELKHEDGVVVDQLEDSSKVYGSHTSSTVPQHYKPQTEEQRALDRKINLKLDIFVVAILSAGFILCGIDKTNIGFIATSTFITDAHLSPNTVATTLTLFSATYVPLQPLSTLAARRIGPKWWIAFLLIIWGALCMAHAAVKNNATLVALRLLLGAAESGFTPSSYYLMSMVYPKYALGMRMGVFSGMFAIAGACAGLISYGLLHINNEHIKGWQVVFLFEGGLTVLVGVLTLLLVPSNVHTAWFLSPTERAHAVGRMVTDLAASQRLEDEAEVVAESDTISLKDITDVLKDWKKLLIMLFNMTGVLPVSAFTTFLPLIVEGMGYNGIRATVMSVPPFVVGAVGLVLIVYSSDRFKERSLHIVGGMLLALVGCIVMATSSDPKLRYGFSHVCLAGVFVSGPLAAVWLAGNTPLKGPRSFALGLNGWTNIGGVIAGQIFNVKYAPTYKVPLVITMVLIAFGAVGMVFVRVMYQLTNRWRTRKTARWGESEHAAEADSPVRRGDQKYTYIYGY